MKRAAAIVALVLLAGCFGDKNVGKVRDVRLLSTSHSDSNKPTRYTLTVEFAMPHGFRLKNNHELTMTSRGRRFRASKSTWSRDGDGVERVTGTFEVPDVSSEFGIVHVGEYDVDVQRRRVTRRSHTP
ncbi:MAG TPA: hypothetical protein VGQ76_04980 [Thermoanaerobaculia bacterium]|nr:hypothetical protein [Thermoanaerobaculia bacterium]